MSRLTATLFFPIALAASLTSCGPFIPKPVEVVTVVRIQKPEIPAELQSCAWVVLPESNITRESELLQLTIDFAFAWADCYRKLAALNRLLAADVAAAGE